MTKACCVINCDNRSHDLRGKRLANGVRFFGFPAWKQHWSTETSHGMLANLTQAAELHENSTNSLFFRQTSL